MKTEQFESIQQCEAAKDVIWFLKGAIVTDVNYPLGSLHIRAIEDLVNYVYNNEREKKDKK